METNTKNLNKTIVPLRSDKCAVSSCCKDTITEHSAHNPMMVCPECKQMIKIFKDEKAFRNYVTFCGSRRREILTGEVLEYFVVIFRNYE